MDFNAISLRVAMRVLAAPDKKDVQRIQDIKTKAGGNIHKAQSLASVMANSIKDKGKMLRRWEAAKQEYPEIADIFAIAYKGLTGEVIPGQHEVKVDTPEEKKEVRYWTRYTKWMDQGDTMHEKQEKVPVVEMPVGADIDEMKKVFKDAMQGDDRVGFMLVNQHGKLSSVIASISKVTDDSVFIYADGWNKHNMQGYAIPLEVKFSDIGKQSDAPVVDEHRQVVGQLSVDDKRKKLIGSFGKQFTDIAGKWADAGFDGSFLGGDKKVSELFDLVNSGKYGDVVYSGSKQLTQGRYNIDTYQGIKFIIHVLPVDNEDRVWDGSIRRFTVETHDGKKYWTE